ncbi:hypothetical protein V6Z11_1Z022600 [Gossypium hirsutum]
MAPLLYFNFRKPRASNHSVGGGGRRLLELEEEDEQLVLKKKSSNFSNKKNQTKLVKPSNVSTKNQTKLVKSVNVSTKNQTKLVKSLNVSTKTSNLSAKNQTKVLKPTNSTKTAKPTVSSSIPKKLNSTSKVKKLNSTTPKASDLLKLSSPKNKTTTKTPVPSSKPEKKPTTAQIQKQQKKQPSWVDDDDESDLVSEFRDLPAKFQQTLIPDLERISTTSKVYINKYNKEFTKQFKPYVGNKHAPTIATVISCAFLLIPLLLVSLIFNRIKAYFSLQKILIFIQIYLSIYFSILCLTSLVTGLEPLSSFTPLRRRPTCVYKCFKRLGTCLLVAAVDSGLGSKMLGLGQIFVGFAVGLHYYVAVFHRVVLHQPPKTNWKVHGMYATFFLVICLFAGVDRERRLTWKKAVKRGRKN